MKNDLSDLYRLKRRDTKKAVETLISSFDSDPLINHMFPSEESKQNELPHY